MACVVIELHRISVQHPPDTFTSRPFLLTASKVDRPFLLWLCGVLTESEVLEVGRWVVDGEVEAEEHRWIRSSYYDEVRSEKYQEEEAVASSTEELRHGYG